MIKTINRHSEWVVFLLGLILMATLNPYSTDTSWCLIELMGFTYCPGEGLGRSIAFLFRGELTKSLEMNLMGPIAVVAMSSRIILLWKKLITENKSDLTENKYV